MAEPTWVMLDGALRAHRLVPIANSDLERVACGRALGTGSVRVDVTAEVAAGKVPSCQRCEPRAIELTPAQADELRHAAHHEGLVRDRIHRTTREHLVAKGLVDFLPRAEGQVRIWQLTEAGWAESRRLLKAGQHG